MNTSKSLDSILRKLLGHDDDCAEEIAEAKQAIVEAVEGLIGENQHVRKNAPPSEQSKVIQENLWKNRMRKAIKEWQ